MVRIAAGILVFLLSLSAARAQDISGQWQGPLHFPNQDLKFILKVAIADGHLHGTAFNPDQSPAGIPVDAVTLEGTTVKFAIAQMHVSFEGTLGADGNSISGQFMQGTTIPLALQRATPATAWATDLSPHKVLSMRVDNGVNLEVLDWGGTGRPLIFLSGLGGTGHGFDSFAPKFTAAHHVYAITRRGYGESSAPDPDHADYSADRLGDDVVAVIDGLKLDRPVLAGHSIAGEELSDIATRHPEKISGLIYLDAGYAYAYYAPGALVPFGFSLAMSMRDVEKDLAAVRASPSPSQSDIQSFQTHLAELEKDIAAHQAFLSVVAPASGPKAPPSLQARIDSAIVNGAEKFTAIPVPVLALYATDPRIPDDVTAAQRAEELAQAVQQAHQADLFEQGVPTARVVRIAGAAHAIWVSNEADVMREMNRFLETLH